MISYDVEEKGRVIKIVYNLIKEVKKLDVITNGFFGPQNWTNDLLTKSDRIAISVIAKQAEGLCEQLVKLDMDKLDD